ncbi:MAG: hypothetical protein HY812_06225 [Planctomycetes bacterium]|nr:hypothetical protein [Planctomycetota bacterium]
MSRFAIIPLRVLLALWPFVAIASLAAPALAQDAFEARPGVMARLAGELLPSFVRVEFALQYDKGASPGTTFRQSPVGDHGGDPAGWGSWEDLVREERPAVRAGYLLAPDLVLTVDPMLHARFIKGITVRAGERVIEAAPAGLARDWSALFLRLKEPVSDGKPLVFDRAAGAPLCFARCVLRDGEWGLDVGAVRELVSVRPGVGHFALLPGDALIVAESGAAAGVAMHSELPLDGSWQGSPRDWRIVSADDMARRLKEFEGAAGAALPRVSLRFRSPSTKGGSSRFSFGGRDSGEMTEWHGSGILVSDSIVVVPAYLNPAITARLESVQVFPPDGSAVAAEFAGSLKDFGCLLARLERPLPGAARLVATHDAAARGELLLRAEVSMLGENRTAYHSHDRVMSYALGWQGRAQPTTYASRGRIEAEAFERSSSGATLDFLFTLDGELFAAPLARREKIAAGRSSGQWRAAGLWSAAELKRVLDDLPQSLDPENRPLPETDENRIAWLGVELQPMNEDLARMNQVGDLTNNGRSGALVCYVYADSPAARAGIAMGDILVRMHVQGQPKPLEVNVGSGDFGGLSGEIWSMMDQISDEYLDRMAAPWGSLENQLLRTLTDIGFGTPFTADVYRDGQVLPMAFVVEESPPHFESASRCKSEAAGLTVRDLTFEVRRYFQVAPADPGVIISKVERGSRAAVAGLKRFEIIRSVDGVPVHGAGDVETRFAAGGEFRLEVKRMREGRIVRIKIDAAGK